MSVGNKMAAPETKDELDFFKAAEEGNNFIHIMSNAMESFKANFELALKARNATSLGLPAAPLAPKTAERKASASVPAAGLSSSDGELMKAGFLLEKRSKSTSPGDEHMLSCQ